MKQGQAIMFCYIVTNTGSSGLKVLDLPGNWHNPGNIWFPVYAGMEELCVVGFKGSCLSHIFS
jgi:hypothetical protein